MSAGIWSCPMVSNCQQPEERTRLVTVLLGFRVETPPDRLQAFISAHNGFEFDGRYRVLALGLGGRLVLSDRVGIRGEARSRWDDRFFGRPPPRGTFLMLGVDLAGPGGFGR